MLYIFIFIIFYLSNIENINSKYTKFNSEFIGKIIKFISPKYYKKIIHKYDVNIQIIENNTITREIFINTSYLSNYYNFEFLYTGKFLYINNTKKDTELFYQKISENRILLIESNSIFNNYISKNIFKKNIKTIIIPNNIYNTLTIKAKECYLESSIYLIKVEKNIFDQLKNIYFKNYNNNHYFVKIISKKLELYLYLNLEIVLLIFIILLSIFVIFYKRIVNSLENKKNFQNDIYGFIKLKLCIIIFLYIHANKFKRLKGFYLYNGSFFLKLAIFMRIVFKYEITEFILLTFSGYGLFIKINKFYFLIFYYLGILSVLSSLGINIFISPSKLSYTFYLINIFIYSQISSIIIFININNISLLIKLNSKIKKK